MTENDFRSSDRVNSERSLANPPVKSSAELPQSVNSEGYVPLSVDCRRLSEFYF